MKYVVMGFGGSSPFPQMPSEIHALGSLGSGVRPHLGSKPARHLVGLVTLGKSLSNSPGLALPICKSGWSPQSCWWLRTEQTLAWHMDSARRAVTITGTFPEMLCSYSMPVNEPLKCCPCKVTLVLDCKPSSPVWSCTSLIRIGSLELLVFHRARSSKGHNCRSWTCS